MLLSPRKNGLTSLFKEVRAFKVLRAMGVLVSQYGRLGAIPPPPFLSVSPFESIREVEVRYPPPPQKGYLSDTGAIPYENKANGCDTPLCDTISKGYCAIWGGISHWAAKRTRECCTYPLATYPLKSARQQPSDRVLSRMLLGH